jgi:hypothetical protein
MLPFQFLQLINNVLIGKIMIEKTKNKKEPLQLLFFAKTTI